MLTFDNLYTAVALLVGLLAVCAVLAGGEAAIVELANRLAALVAAGCVALAWLAGCSTYVRKQINVSVCCDSW
jgi:hypothetical protein